MPCTRSLLYRSGAVILLSLMPYMALAGDVAAGPDHPHPRACCHGCRAHYWRHADHGLLHYPQATYWTSFPAPSPWAYWSIPPYPHHYHFFYGDGYSAAPARLDGPSLTPQKN